MALKVNGHKANPTAFWQQNKRFCNRKQTKPPSRGISPAEAGVFRQKDGG
jgi:hypothetical protein